MRLAVASLLGMRLSGYYKLSSGYLVFLRASVHSTMSMARVY